MGSTIGFSCHPVPPPRVPGAVGVAFALGVIGVGGAWEIFADDDVVGFLEIAGDDSGIDGVGDAETDFHRADEVAVLHPETSPCEHRTATAAGLAGALLPPMP